MDALMLSRMQFAANISFHILFPTITLALAWILLFFKARFAITGNQHWIDAYNFWVKVFALTFALGVVSGITMSFQFGTNWPGFMETVGNIAGPLLAYEVLTAFFLEATFLGIMLFGRQRVADWVHTLATALVAIGTSLSAFWIISLNSWMHTPAGFEMRGGEAFATDWLAIVFNPSMPYRMTHMMIASGLTAAFLVSGLSAYRWLRGEHSAPVLLSLKTGVWLAALLIPLQVFVGDLHGLNTLAHQPAKIAAIEGAWHTENGAPLLLFAMPDAKTHSNRFEIGIPKMASLLLTHSLDGELKGFDAFAGQHPPMAPVFYGFRIMVGTGMLMWLVSWWAAWRLRPLTLNNAAGLSSNVLRALVVMTFSGWVATLAGWYVTEIGRQPFLVTGVLKTVDAIGPVAATTVATSLLVYLLLYVGLLIAYIATLFFLARRGAGIPVHVPPSAHATLSAGRQ